MNELKPCPFCGSPADTTFYEEGGWSVGCDTTVGCAILDTSFETAAEAIAAWNQRTTEPSEENSPESQGGLSSTHYSGKGDITRHAEGFKTLLASVDDPTARLAAVVSYIDDLVSLIHTDDGPGEVVAWAPYLEDEEFTKPEDGVLFDGRTGYLVAFFDKEAAEKHHGGKYPVMALYRHPQSEGEAEIPPGAQVYRRTTGEYVVRTASEGHRLGNPAAMGEGDTLAEALANLKPCPPRTEASRV